LYGWGKAKAVGKLKTLLQNVDYFSINAKQNMKTNENNEDESTLTSFPFAWRRI